MFISYLSLTSDVFKLRKKGLRNRLLNPLKCANYSLISIVFSISLTVVTTSSATECCTEGPLQMQIDLPQSEQDLFLSDTSYHQTMVP